MVNPYRAPTPQTQEPTQLEIALERIANVLEEWRARGFR